MLNPPRSIFLIHKDLGGFSGNGRHEVISKLSADCFVPRIDISSGAVD